MVETNGRVQGSQVYDIKRNPGDLCLVLAMLIYTLPNAAACATPVNTLEKHVPEQIVGDSQVDNSAVVTLPQPCNGRCQ